MSDVRKIRGGALLARALKEKGIEHVFTLSGGFCNPALEGFMECQMKVVNCPHEQVAGHLLVRAVDYLHLAFHEAFKRRVAEPAREGEDMLDALFLQRAREKGAAADFADVAHVPPETAGPNPGCDCARQWRPMPAIDLWPSRPIAVPISVLI